MHKSATRFNLQQQPSRLRPILKDQGDAELFNSVLLRACVVQGVAHVEGLHWNQQELMQVRSIPGL
jgi:hypothetical protein